MTCAVAHLSRSKLPQELKIEVHPPNFQAAEPGSHAPPRRGDPPGQSSSRSPAAEASEDDANLNIGTCHPPRARVSGSRVDAPVAPTRTTCSTKSLVRVALELMATVVPVADGRPGRKGTGAEGPRRGGAGGRRPRAHVSFNSLAVKKVSRPFCDCPRVCSCR